MSKCKVGIYFIVCFSILCTVVLASRMVYAEEEHTDDDQIVVVSLGDSYSSGEGIEPFGIKKTLTEKVNDPDWLAHRSERSWQSMLCIPGLDGYLGDYREKP